MNIYWLDGATWTLVGAVIDEPVITKKNNMYGICTIQLRDFELALYDSWSARDYTEMKILDDDDEVLFRGYLINKKFRSDNLELTLAGIGFKLDWVEFNRDYILAEGKVRTVPNSDTLTLYDDLDESGDYTDASEDFAWAVDYWITDQDVGLLIVDNTNTISTTTWEVVAEGGAGDYVTNATYVNGDNDSCDTALDNETYYLTEDAVTWDGVFAPTIGGANIATTQKLYKIIINYRVGFKIDYGTFAPYWVCEIKKDGAWVTSPPIFKYKPFTVGEYIWIEDEHEIVESNTELAKYLTVDGANYDEIQGIRIRFLNTPGAASEKGYCKIDKLTVSVKYEANEISPIMAAITDSAASTLTCDGHTWDEEGVDVNDIFKIGQNTIQIVSDVAAKIELEIAVIQTAEDSSIATLRPDGDDTTEWDNHTDSGGDGSHWKDLDEVVVDPNAGDGNIISTSTALDEDIFTMGTTALGAGEVVTQIDVHVYGKRLDILAGCYAAFYSTSTDWSSEKTAIPTSDNSYHWSSCTWANLSLSQADLDSLKIKFTHYGALSTSYIDCFYVVVTYGTLTPFSKFIARKFKGTHCIDVIKAVCNLEGAYWVEDYANNRLKLVKPSNFENSNVELTSADYADDWEYEDQCNQYRRVDVFGNAAYNIHQWVDDPSIDGWRAKQIIDETITTSGDAYEVASAQHAILSVKRPSLKLTLFGTYPDLDLGKYVNVILEEPDGTEVIAATDYNIRLIRRSQYSMNLIKTEVYCGLGETDADEKAAKILREVAFLANKALADRLVSTLWTSGAALTWNDVSGADAGARSACIEDTVYGAGWNGDTSHAPTQNAVYDAMEAIKTNYNKNEKIGSDNKDWIVLGYEDSNLNTRSIKTASQYINVGADDTALTFHVPLEYVKTDLDGNTKNLIITQTEIGIYDADEGDEVNRVRWQGWSAYDTESDFLDTGGGLDEDTPSDYTWDHADTTIGGVYKRINCLVNLTCTDAADTQLCYVRVQYYYG